MLQARSEQPGDTPSPEASATLQQPQNNLQPTGSTNGNSTSTPQTTPNLTQQQLQSPNLRVGNTQTLIANSTVAQPGTNQPNAAATWLWVAVPLVVLAVVAWRIRAMSATARTVLVANTADVPAAPAPTKVAGTTAAVPAPAASPAKPQPAAKKAKKTAKSSRRQRKQKRS